MLDPKSSEESSAPRHRLHAFRSSAGAWDGWSRSCAARTALRAYSAPFRGYEMACAKDVSVPLFPPFAGTMVLRRCESCLDGRRNSSKRAGGMVVAVAAQPTTAAGSGPRWRSPVQDDASGPLPRVRGPPVRSPVGLRHCCEGSGTMKRLAVALALTLPMMMLAAPNALAAKPTYERVPVDATFIEESCGVPVEFHIVGVSVTI